MERDEEKWLRKGCDNSVPLAEADPPSDIGWLAQAPHSWTGQLREYEKLWGAKSSLFQHFPQPKSGNREVALELLFSGKMCKSKTNHNELSSEKKASSQGGKFLFNIYSNLGKQQWTGWTKWPLPHYSSNTVHYYTCRNHLGLQPCLRAVIWTGFAGKAKKPVSDIRVCK